MVLIQINLDRKDQTVSQILRDVEELPSQVLLHRRQPVVTPGTVTQKKKGAGVKKMKLQASLVAQKQQGPSKAASPAKARLFAYSCHALTESSDGDHDVLLVDLVEEADDNKDNDIIAATQPPGSSDSEMLLHDDDTEEDEDEDK